MVPIKKKIKTIKKHAVDVIIQILYSKRYNSIKILVELYQISIFDIGHHQQRE